MDYINEDTEEWGLCEGDITLNPNAKWSQIFSTPKPDIKFNQDYERLKPKKIDNKWYEQWSVKDLSEIQINIKKGIHNQGE